MWTMALVEEFSLHAEQGEHASGPTLLFFGIDGWIANELISENQGACDAGPEP